MFFSFVKAIGSIGAGAWAPGHSIPILHSFDLLMNYLQDKLPSDDIPPGARSVPGTPATGTALVSSVCLLLPTPTANRGDKY